MSRWLPGRSLLLAWALFVLLFAAARAPFFLHYPLPAIYGDSTSYYSIAELLTAGRWPDFSMRPPVYPVILYATAPSGLVVVVALQCLLSMVSGLTMIWAASKWRWWMALPAAAAMSAFMVSTQHIEHDTAIMAESVLTSLTVIGSAGMVAALSTPSAIAAAVASAAFALAILTKPAAHFLLVIMALLIAFVLWNRYPRRFVVALIAPMAAILLSMCAYNKSVSGAFTTTAFGESQIAFATLTFWDQDPAYPEEINLRIANAQKYMDEVMQPEDRLVLATSWDPLALARVFNKGFSYAALAGLTKPPVGGGDDYLGMRAWIRKISIDAIRRHPSYYAKFVYTQLLTYYGINVVSQEVDFIGYLRNRATMTYSPSFGQAPNNTRSWSITQQHAAELPPFVSIGSDGRAQLNETPSVAVSLYEAILRVRRGLFANRAWIALFFTVLAASLYRVVATRAHEPGPFLLLLLNLGVIGSCLVVSLVEVAMPRYGYVMEFVYYLDIVFLSMLWQRAAAAAKVVPRR